MGLFGVGANDVSVGMLVRVRNGDEDLCWGGVREIVVMQGDISRTMVVMVMVTCWSWGTCG